MTLSADDSAPTLPAVSFTFAVRFKLPPKILFGMKIATLPAVICAALIVTKSTAVVPPLPKIWMVSPALAFVPVRDTSKFSPLSRRLTTATSAVATAKLGALFGVVSMLSSVTGPVDDVLPAASVLVAVTSTVSLPTNCPALAV